jgi:hypothetical protein
MTPIGPNFSNELAAAGLHGLPFAWGGDGAISYGPAITSAQKTSIQAVLAAHNAATPDLTQQVQVNSTGTPALNGVYAIDDVSQSKIAAIAAGIAAKNRVPGGGSTFNYFDVSGVAHAFTAANFLDFAAVIEDYAYTVDLQRAALAAGQKPVWPSSPLTIA